MAWELNNETPIYVQLVEILEHQILSGIYQSGEKLPTVRELASIAAVNPNTMQKALSELERKGLVFTNRTAGRYVTDNQELLDSMKKQLANHLIEEFFRKMKQIGYDEQSACNQLSQQLKERAI